MVAMANQRVDVDESEIAGAGSDARETRKIGIRTWIADNEKLFPLSSGVMMTLPSTHNREKDTAATARSRTSTRSCRKAVTQSLPGRAAILSNSASPSGA